MAITVSFFDDGLSITDSRHSDLSMDVAPRGIIGSSPYYVPHGISLDYHLDNLWGFKSSRELVEWLITELDRKGQAR